MRWKLKAIPEPTKVEKLEEELQVNSIIASLLIQRGIENFSDAKHFFRPNLNQLHDPFLMQDMAKAVKRIEAALANKENILVYGDYDVDGTTSVALLSSYLDTKSNSIATYIPDRYSEGYGVSYEGINFASDNNFTLIIALDCGIKAIEKVAYATKKGIDFIICDHHRPNSKLPPAVAVLNPKRSDCKYPYKELCGCGIGFKLIQALAANKNQTVNNITPFLDLVATAIAADIVPITGENRILAYFGLQVINTKPRPGIKALMQKHTKKRYTISDVVFKIAPRINAAGRMQHGNYAVALLKEKNSIKAKKIAEEIEAFNTQRREADLQITEQAIQQIKENQEENRSTNVVYNKTWHKGVIGIVASRLIETYYKPTLVFTKSGDYLAASARSVAGFDIYDALTACEKYIEQFGGHKYAAGLTLKEENYDAFKQAFENVVTTTLKNESKTPEIVIDSRIQLNEITPKFWRILKQFAPFGPGNKAPIFLSENVYDTGYGKSVGENHKHLRITITQTGTEKFTGIGFNLGNKLELIKNKQKFKTVYTIEENEWQNKISLQLKLKDITT